MVVVHHSRFNFVARKFQQEHFSAYVLKRDRGFQVVAFTLSKINRSDAKPLVFDDAATFQAVACNNVAVAARRNGG